ncbi:MAG: hypothetical protein FJW32_05680 [Acidobacteria bacterium]|nr:hypothetical protein [Acidobacteriota bacterium]
MTLHPDIITDLVILYHAGEASQATRKFLEEEAGRNAQVAAALAAAPRAVAALPGGAVDERRAFRKIRIRYVLLALGAAWCLALLIIALFAQMAPPHSAVTLLINLLPFALLTLFFAVAVAALFFIVRKVR